MKLLLHSFIVALLISGLSFGQAALIQSAVNAATLETGFVVITPLMGNADGLNVSATLGEQIGGNFSQTSVVPSPLITLTDVVVSADPTTGLDTGIAIANPTATPATVTLDLRNGRGVTVSSRTITIREHHQISRFVTELFAGDPVFSQPVTAVLFIGSDVPIGVLGLALNGTSFTALPVAAQLSTNNVIAVAVPSPAPAAGTSTTTAVVNGFTLTPATAVSVPGTPTFNGVTVPPTILPTPTTILPIPTTILPTPTVTPIAGVASPVVISTGQLTAGSVAASQATSTFSATPQSVTPVSTIGFPQLTAGVGGSGALLLPQVATGNGWVTQITIANTSALTQTVRVDFFNPQGAPLAVPSGATVSSILIAPGGVAVLTL